MNSSVGDVFRTMEDVVYFIMNSKWKFITEKHLPDFGFINGNGCTIIPYNNEGYSLFNSKGSAVCIDIGSKRTYCLRISKDFQKVHEILDKSITEKDRLKICADILKKEPYALKVRAMFPDAFRRGV